MVKIVTSICVDTDTKDSQINYPNSGDFLSSNAKRKIYWKLVTTFCASSIRCNPQEQHYVYTNDLEKVIVKNIDIKQFLDKLGVKIVYLPFEEFLPPDRYCSIFKNAYYKLDVLAALSRDEASSSILLDSDCLWNRHDNSLFKVINSDSILLRDTFEMKDAHTQGKYNLSMADMGKVFQKIDPDYPCLYPIWYGGEIIGGQGKKLKVIAEQLRSLLKKVSQPKFDHSSLTLPNGKTFFDGMEYCTSFVYNQGLVEVYDAKKYLKRIWTLEQYNNVKTSDLQIPIWHLPAEKRAGLSLLFNKAINLKSKFWQISLDDFPYFLGEYVGVPERKLSFFNHKYLQSSVLYWRIRSRVLRSLNKAINLQKKIELFG